MALIQEDNNDVYFNFINSIKSDVTKEIYEYNLQVFMKFCNVETFQDLLIPNPQNQIIKHLMSLREKGLSSNSISTRLNAIYHFYDMNDVYVSLNYFLICCALDGVYTREYDQF